MRSFTLWLLGAAGAFFATAGAFLFLANLAAGPGRSGPIPQTPQDTRTAEPALALRFADDRLEELESAPGQRVLLYVENRGEETMPQVDVTLSAASESTVKTRARDYRTSVRDLAPKERRAVELEVDLSPPKPAEKSYGSPSDDGPEGEREILEARAAAPGGRPAVQTAVSPR